MAAARGEWGLLPRPLVLASRSPQRRAILEQLGVPFEGAPHRRRRAHAGDPAWSPGEHARRKAAAATEAARPGLAAAAAGHVHVLAVDTVVALDGRIYDKPADEAAARAGLRALAGRTHEVIGGLVLDDRATIAVTKVTFRALDDALLDWYLATGEWRDRAGGYAIQGRGAALVHGIEGDYLNVVGLPLAALLDVMESSAFPP
ncbi:MAG: Maf family nucleotide pyrophosphatase [Solirubrobacteraceae bacterium]